MAQTVFKVIANYERDIKKKALKSATPETKEFVNSFADFLASGIYTDSKVDKFIAANFRLSPDELTKKWNIRKFDKPKSVNTFRGQISMLSSYICSVFEFKVHELSEAIATNNTDFYENIEYKMDAFKVEIRGIDVNTRFALIKQMLPADIELKSYSFDECQKEFNLLKVLDSENIKNLFNGVDLSKLVFLLSLCEESLVDISYKESENKVHKDRLVKLNSNKLDFCHALLSSKLVDINELSTLARMHFDEGIDKDNIEIRYVEVPEKTPYSLIINKEAADILTAYTKTYESYARAHKGSDEYVEKAGDEREVFKVNKYFDTLTLEGFASYIKRLNPYLVNKKVKELLKERD